MSYKYVKLYFYIFLCKSYNIYFINLDIFIYYLIRVIRINALKMIDYVISTNDISILTKKKKKKIL
ncbi:hypothetical protein PFAG_02624 [Plasmodium falciparum Santa Lucia]|uniref:Uncharacterized protein n=4 Tax=Plasmodium falciparum TaxID=5833 RepID=A0A024W7E5_PLAFA|nr:hypothetical protein PFTANZ_02697 [Plasmodium falciparum Tanzania (2000708)]ETW42900.1 hypothetical protein PFNF135_02794 [Plasmodium falciparum NF135/5.C10]EUR72211.1 hypothetical protein PFBG_02713 [Plasmodium falciparum 7G8]EUT86165.1 hypothetical protein PFAG_02624 [Plasmodium falciparum Santa Lucia]